VILLMPLGFALSFPSSFSQLKYMEVFADLNFTFDSDSIFSFYLFFLLTNLTKIHHLCLKYQVLLCKLTTYCNFFCHCCKRPIRP